MELLWSTATFRPSKSITSSFSLVWFSKAMWYWKPEQPPPTTATRRAVGTGLCIFMISLTLLAATGLHSRLGRETVHEIKYSTDGNELERLCKRDISRYQ